LEPGKGTLPPRTAGTRRRPRRGRAGDRAL